MKRILIFIPLIFLTACASKRPVIVKMPPSLPATSTYVDRSDAKNEPPVGRAFLGAHDLVTLAALIGEIKSRRLNRRRRVK